MTPEAAKAVFDFLNPQIGYEAKLTRRVLAAVPADKADYSPDDTSMNALKLSAHIAEAEKMFLHSVLKGEFEMPSGSAPLDTPEHIVSYYDAEVMPLIDRLPTLSAEHFAKEIPVFGGMWPVIGLLQIYVKHTVHHRGQLAAYLRPMGAKVPSIYGPSADEPHS